MEKSSQKLSQESLMFRTNLLRIARERERWGKAFTAMTGNKQYEYFFNSCKSRIQDHWDRNEIEIM